MPAYKFQAEEMPVLDAISDAYGEFQCLLDEMTEKRDAMEEKWSATERYQTTSDTCDTLESNVDEPSVPTEIEALCNGVSITVGLMVPTRKKNARWSRQVRFDNAVARLTAAVDHFTELLDSNDDTNDDSKKLSEDMLQEVESFRDELQTTVDNLDGACEFPGMYG